MGWLLGNEREGMRGCCSKDMKFRLNRWVSPRNLLYDIVPLVNMRASLVAEHEESAAMQETGRRCRFDFWVGKIPWRRKWQSTPVFLPGKLHGQRSLDGYSP